MALISYRDSLHLSNANVEKLHEVNQIIVGYQLQGYKMTLRQLYYQLVTRNIIENKVAEYKKLTNLIAKGRMGGQVDWDAIEDRLRVPKLPYWVHSIGDALNDTAGHYRMNRQRNQENYVEVWCEKDALSSVLERVTREFHIRLMVNRGYTSVTAMHDAFQRMRNNKHNSFHNIWGHKRNTILYLGDHDPSGLDMVRDIEDRMDEFGIACLNVKHIALTWDQVENYDPPPNPAKFSDPRAKWYMDRWGKESWEVDALPPDVLDKLLRTSIEEEIDMDIYTKSVDEEEEDRATLKQIAEDHNG